MVDSACARSLKRHHGIALEPLANLLGQIAALDFQGGREREIVFPDEIAADAFVIREAAGCARSMVATISGVIVLPGSG